MKLHTLSKTTRKSKRRVGRGYGSTLGGHTSGRGSKGQKSRNSVPIFFEGGQLPLTKRLPYWRGKSRFKSLTANPMLVKLSDLNALKKNTEVNPKTLVEAGIITERDLQKHSSVKILNSGTLEVALTIQVPISEAARQKVEKAGGKVEWTS